MPASSPAPRPLVLPASRWRSALVQWVLVVVLSAVAFGAVPWQTLQVSRWDVFGYYLYLPATTVYHDLDGLGFVPELLDRTQLTNRDNPQHPLGNWEVSRARTHPDRYVIKYTMGQALLWWPFFQAAHYYAQHSGGRYPPDGYSLPYQQALYLAGLCYALLGLGLLRRLLLHYFSDQLTAALLAVIYLGTNYFVYSTARSLYAHNNLFVLHTATLLLLTHWLARPRWWLAAALGSTTGLAVLIRPSEGIILLAPLLLGVASRADLRARLRLAEQHAGHVALAGLVAAGVNLPQLLYWHRTSGHWVYDSYPTEKFDFLHPHLLDGLFSFNNGWLTYTPVMALALVGIGLLWRRRRGWFWLLITYLPLHLLISYSWWCWWYEDSVGSRTMVQAYPLLALPLGVALHTLWQRGWLVRAATTTFIGFCIWLNSFQFYQMLHGIFVTEFMTPSYYAAIFGKTHLQKDDIAKFDVSEGTPDPRAYRTEQAYFNDFAHDTTAQLDRALGPTPPVALVDRAHPFSTTYQQKLGAARLRPHDWLVASAQAYFPEKETNTNQMPRLVIEFHHAGDGEAYRWQGMRITNKIGEIGSIWSGTAGVWGEVKFACHVPTTARPDDEVRVYVINGASDKKLYIDDLRVDLLRQP